MKILHDHGGFVGEQVGKLVDHVALALLPAAVEVLKQAKLIYSRFQKGWHCSRVVVASWK
jgi:hypothetical protein